MKPETQRFLEIMEAQNRRVAEAEAAKTPKPDHDIDPIRAQREQERRERWGQLRAREKPGKRPHRARSIFGYTDVS